MTRTPTEGEMHDQIEGENEARARVDALFERFNALTPAELPHIGLHRPDAGQRRAYLETAEAAARDADRTDLLGEARAAAGDMVLRRYSEGTLNPTWAALNWGVSEGTVNDRLAIIGALSDAVTAAVVADLVAPEVVEALSVDADHILGLAPGAAYEGALSRAIEPPPAGLPDAPGRTAVVYGGALFGGLAVLVAGNGLVGPPAGVAGGLVFAMIVIAQGRRGPGERSRRTPSGRGS